MKKAVNSACADRVKQYPKGALHADNGGCFALAVTLQCIIHAKDRLTGTFRRQGTKKNADFRMNLNNIALRSKKRFPARSKVTEVRHARHVSHYFVCFTFMAETITYKMP